MCSDRLGRVLAVHEAQLIDRPIVQIAGCIAFESAEQSEKCMPVKSLKAFTLYHVALLGKAGKLCYWDELLSHSTCRRCDT